MEWSANNNAAAKLMSSSKSSLEEGKKVGVVLAKYTDVFAICQARKEWWRCVLDEPQGVLTARPTAGYIQTSGYIEACASIKACRRWCVSGTPFTNELFEVFGQVSYYISKVDIRLPNIPIQINTNN